MHKEDWIGVMPAITTPFNEKGEIDLGFMRKHARQMIEAGCTGMVTPGSLGEGGTLTADEKARIWSGLAEELEGRAPVIAAVSALSTEEAVQTARHAQKSGCTGLMILPPYAYSGRWEETRGHFAAIMKATELSCMLYNNPIAYDTDLTPEQIKVLADRHQPILA